MPADRLAMRQIKDILRLRHDAGLSLREIARSLNLSVGVVSKYLQLAAAAGIGWPPPAELDEDALVRKLQPPPPAILSATPLPDFAELHQELRRKGVTLQLLWEEYAEANPAEHYSYPHFCMLYREWRQRLSPTMRQTHAPGDKMFVDYCGPTIPVIDALTGEVRDANIFVAVLGASNYTYVDAIPMLDHIQASFDFSTQFNVVQITTEENSLDGFAQFSEGFVGRMLQVIARETTQDGFGLGGPKTERGRVFHHLLILLFDQFPINGAFQDELQVRILFRVAGFDAIEFLLVNRFQTRQQFKTEQPTKSEGHFRLTVTINILFIDAHLRAMPQDAFNHRGGF